MATRSETFLLRILADASGLKSSLKESDQAAKSAQKSIDGLADAAKELGGFALDIGRFSAGTKLIADSTQAYGELINVQNTATKVFNDQAAAIDDWASDSVNAVGLSKRAAIESATYMAGLGKQVGLAGDELAAFSTSVVELGADLAAAFNTDVAQAIGAIQSGFSGSSVEPLRRYNIVINDTALKQRYLELTGEKVTNVLTQQQRSVAFLSLLYEKSADYVGQWDLESEQLLGTQQRLKASWEDFQASLGESTAPVLTGFINQVNDLFGVFSGLNEASNGAVGTIAAYGIAAGSVAPLVKRTSTAMLGMATAAGTSARAASVLGSAASALGPSLAIGTGLMIGWALANQQSTRMVQDNAQSMLQLAAAKNQLDFDEQAAGLQEFLDKSIELNKFVGEDGGGMNEFVQGFEQLAQMSPGAAQNYLDMMKNNEELIASFEAAGYSVEDFQEIIQTQLELVAGRLSGEDMTQMLLEQQGLVDDTADTWHQYGTDAVSGIGSAEDAAEKAAKAFVDMSDAIDELNTNRVESIADSIGGIFDAKRGNYDYLQLLRDTDEALATLADWDGTEWPSLEEAYDFDNEDAGALLDGIRGLGEAIGPALSEAFARGGDAEFLAVGESWADRIRESLSDNMDDDQINEILAQLGLTDAQLQATLNLSVEATMTEEAKTLLGIAQGAGAIGTEETLVFNALIETDPEEAINFVYARWEAAGLQLPAGVDVDYREAVETANDYELELDIKGAYDSRVEHGKIQGLADDEGPIEIDAEVPEYAIESTLEWLLRPRTLEVVPVIRDVPTRPGVDWEPLGLGPGSAGAIPVSAGAPITNNTYVTVPTADPSAIMRGVQRWSRTNGALPINRGR